MEAPTSEQQMTVPGNRQDQLLRQIFGRTTFVDKVTRIRNNARVDSGCHLDFQKALNLKSAQYWRILRECGRSVPIFDPGAGFASLKGEYSVPRNKKERVLLRYFLVVATISQSQMLSDAALTLEVRAQRLSSALGFRVSARYLSWVYKSLGVSKRKMLRLYRTPAQESMKALENME